MKFRPKPSGKTRQSTRLRTLLYAATLSVASVTAISLYISQFLDNRDGYATGSPMVFTTLDVVQDTTPVFRGTMNQQLLGVTVNTTGKNNKLRLNSFKISTRGTSPGSIHQIKNIRLWSTGSANNFATTHQIGKTVLQVTGSDIILEAHVFLQEGPNHFWVTCDIDSDEAIVNQVVDAELISVRIGTLDYDPPVSAPPGARTIILNIPYYSAGNGDISAITSWNTQRDGSGTHPEKFSQPRSTFHIQSGHTMKNELSGCLPAIIIEGGAVLISKSAVKTEMLEIQSGGNFIQQAGFNNPHSISLFRIRNGGNYIHANSGVVPGKYRDFQKRSNVIFTETGNATFSNRCMWGNVVIDIQKMKSINFGNTFKYIGGNLELRNTGGENYFYTTSSDSILIEGDLIINGGNLVLNPTSKQLVVSVRHGLYIKSGSLTDTEHGTALKSRVVLTGLQHCFITNGTIKLEGTDSQIKFTRQGSTWFQQNDSRVKLPDMIIEQGASLTIKSDYLGQIGPHKTLTVAKSGTLHCESGVITGPGSLVLENDATISTSHSEGFNSESDSGSVATQYRYFNSSANYVYTGSVSPQHSGRFTTSPVDQTVKNLEILKSSVSDVVILNQPVKVAGNFILKRGNLNKNGFELEKPKTYSLVTPVP